MPQMTPAQARVVDPVLTQVARGFSSPAFAGMALFPAVPVGARGGRVIEFGKEHFRLYNTARAPGAQVVRITAGHGSKTFALEQHAVEEPVPYELLEDAQAVPKIDLGAAAVQRGLAIIGLRLEKIQADLARNAANYPASNKLTLSGPSQWSDPGSDPVRAIEEAKEVVRGKIGVRPNTLLVSASVFAALKTHPVITDRIKYTSREVATPELLASLFGLERVVVGDAVYDDGSAMVDVWGKDAILAFTALGSIDAAQPTFGYTYRLEGMPIVEEPYQDRQIRSWVYPVIDEVAPVIAGAEAGFLFQNAVA
ncbi:MAG: hypothetical protein KatS3mg125_1382 [Lysobacterales bacterium]|nr:MAG: hypothetical protein KatS3mg125_1382 [Xanthomonadales bacterium]